MRDSPRTRRLRSDQQALQRLQGESSIVQFHPYGDPAEAYLVRYRGTGVAREEGSGRIVLRDLHEVRITLNASYPRLMPELSWQTPIYHPNISASGVVCLGGYGTYWSPGLSLAELCEMLWDMVRYKNVDPNSPYNREAAAWVKLQNEYRLPLDDRPLRNLVAAGLVKAQPSPGGPHGKKESEMIFLDDVIDAEILETPPRDDDVLYID